MRAIFFFIFLSFSTAVLASRDFYLRLSKTLPYPSVLTENSSAQLMDSVQALLGHYELKRVAQERHFTYDGKIFLVSAKVPTTLQTTFGPAPVDGFWAAHGAIVRTSKELGLSDKSAEALGFRIQKHIITDLGGNWDAYLQELEIKLSDQDFEDARRELVGKVNYTQSFDIPYLAGYSTEKPWTLYIDSGIKDPVAMPDGRKLHTIPFLLLHEAFEKALIDELKLTEKSYLRTHQLAQRLEREAVEVAGFTWSDYQGKIMGPEIARADDEKRVLKRVPANLDLTPYRDYKDWQLIRKMKKAMLEKN
jgi:hypothetical protein